MCILLKNSSYASDGNSAKKCCARSLMNLSDPLVRRYEQWKFTRRTDEDKVDSSVQTYEFPLHEILSLFYGTRQVLERAIVILLNI